MADTARIRVVVFQDDEQVCETSVGYFVGQEYHVQIVPGHGDGLGEDATTGPLVVYDLTTAKFYDVETAKAEAARTDLE